MSPMITPTCSLHAGNLILVNGAHPCREPLPEQALVPVNGTSGEVLLERRAAALLEKLMGEIRGWAKIVAVSGWRSRDEQQQIWNNAMEEHGEIFTKQYVAPPGCSEHETGLAIDLGLKQEPVDDIRPAFPYTGICQTFRQKAARYGFIQRYPEGKEHITGIAHEPWHFRYVGAPHAEIMTRFGFTLEEYHLFLMRYPQGKRSFLFDGGTIRFEISYLHSYDAIHASPIAEDGYACMISGNNAEGFIITRWKERGG